MKKIYCFLLSLVIFSFLGFTSIASAQTIEYKVTSGAKSVTLTHDYDLNDGSSAHSHIDVSCNPSLSQDRTMDLVGDNIIEQTIVGETNGNTNYKGISIVGTGSAEELTVTTTSYSTHDTHSLDQTLNGKGDAIWSIVGVGNISTTGSGIEIDPPQITIDAGVQAEGAIAGVGAFGNAKIVNTTLHTDTSHSASASADIGKAKGRFVVAGAGAGNIEASLEGTVITTLEWPPSLVDASGTINAGAEAAVIGGAAVGKNARIVNTTLNVDTSHSAHASGDIYAIGAAVVVGAAAGNVQASSDPSFALGAEGAVIGGWGSRGGIDGILPLPPQDEWFQDAYMIDATNLNATTKIGEGTSVEGDVAVAGGLFPDSEKAAGVAAGYAHIPPDPSDAYQYGRWSGDGEQAIDRKTGNVPLSGHGTASVNKDVPVFDAKWND